MSKKTFIWFGLLVLFLAVIVPWLAFRSDGDAARSAAGVPAALRDGQGLFATNCGNCHALTAAGTGGNFGPDLDRLLAPGGPPTGSSAEQTIEASQGRVLNAIEEGVDSPAVPGRMPGGILTNAQAEEVAEFVARTAGRG